MTPLHEPMTRRRLLQGAACAAAAAVVGACTGERAVLGPDTVLPALALPSVALVGDSISWLSRTELEAALTEQGFGRIEFDALSGRRIAEGESSGLQILDSMIARGVTADAWIIELGTNDLGAYDANGYGELIDLVVEKIPHTSPLVWVDTFSSFNFADAELFNEVLRQRMTARGGAAVADWYAKCIEVGPERLIPDGLHPTGEGLRTFAEVAVAPISLVA
jgi:lysophospholipase L1-like esterase